MKLRRTASSEIANLHDINAYFSQLQEHAPHALISLTMHQRTLFAASRGFFLSRRTLPTPFTCRSCRPRFAARRSLATLPNLSLFRALKNHNPSSLAVTHNPSSRSFTYENLVADVLQSQDRLRQAGGGRRDGLRGERVAFLAENSYDYVGTVLPCLPYILRYISVELVANSAK